MAMKMSNGRCRLCLDPCVPCFNSIIYPDLKKQMEKVFSFSVTRIAGLSSDVCKSCTCTINEFYQYSERVRLNQETLIRMETEKRQSLNGPFVCKGVKIELNRDEELQESPEEQSLGSTSGISSSTNQILNGMLPIEHIKVEMDSEAANIEFFSEEEHQTAETNQEPVFNNEEYVCDGIKIEPNRIEEFRDLIDEQHASTSSTQAGSILNLELMSGKNVNTELDNDVQLVLQQHIPQSRLSLSLDELHTIRRLVMSQSLEQLVQMKTNREKEDQFISQHFTLTCYICQAVEPTFQKLRDHFRVIHNVYNVYVTCCKEKFSTRGNLISHIKGHDKTGPKNSQAPMEPLEPAESDEVLKLRAKREKEDRFIAKHFTLTCHVCSEIQPTFTELRNHVQTRHNTYNVYVTCCKEQYSTRSHLISHLEDHLSGKLDRKNKRLQPEPETQEANSSENGHICPQCGREFKYRFSLERHNRVIHERMHQPLTRCKICRRMVVTETYKHHWHRMHSKEKFVDETSE